MVPWRLIINRTLVTESKKNDIGQVFIKDNVQKLLKDITRFDEKVLFARRRVSKLKTPQMMFMTDDQLRRAKEAAYEQVEARLQMPPVMAPDNSEPKVIARDDEIVGYTKFKIVFVDITPGYSNRNRLMSIREPNGTLRYPNHVERSRLNHIFYPSETASIDSPKLFEEAHLSKLLKRKEYVFLLNRACIQFEPDDPRFINITSQIYNYIDDKKDFDKLRSTRYFGPMSLFLAYEKRADNLILEMLAKGLVGDAAKLVKVYNTCHNIEYRDEDDDLNIIRYYTDNCSPKKYNLDLALQELANKDAVKS